MAETVAFTECKHCGKGPMAVKINRSGKAYGTCDHCGVSWKHTWQRSSDTYVQSVSGAAPAAPAAPKPAPAAAPTTPKPAPAAPKVPTPTPKPPPAAAPAPRASTLLG